jgi:AraC family transcriptional regulator
MRRNQHYHDRVNRVLDYITTHLDDDLSLAKLSEVGCFSPFHFHRIFHGLTSETLNNHVRRVRLERAATLMKASPHRRITDVAMEAGFAGTAEFSRAFKNHFGRTASSWDRRSPLEKSKIRKAPETFSFDSEEELKRWKASKKDLRVRLHRFSGFRYVYNRTFAAYGNTHVVDNYRALIEWLKTRCTDPRDVVVIGMSMDDPSITPSEQCRYDLGIAFPREPGGILGEIVRARGGTGRPRESLPTRSECDEQGFSIRDFDAHAIVSLHCAGDIAHAARVWQYLYRIWLPPSSLEPANLPAMEIFVELLEEIGWETFDLQACIPVVRF